MLLHDVHQYYGTWSHLTRELKLGMTTYQNWVRKGYIPYTTQLVIEKKTKGRFVANENHCKPPEVSKL